jgi:1-acyl-sn-glycerol-3-phosphate acyltransferase
MMQPISYQHVFSAIHTILICLWTIVITVVLGLLAIVLSFFSKTGNSVHIIARIWGRTILWVSGIRVTISGVDQIDLGRPYIFMSNHQSNFDIPVLLSSLLVQFRWLAKAELFKIPIFGRSMRGAGYISIDRSDRKSAFQSLARAAEIIRNGASVMIFPEGTRSHEGDLLAFKKGGFVLAVDAGVPVIPLIIRGTRTIMPKGRLRIQTGAVQVKLLPPIASADFTRKNKDALIERVRAAMIAELAAETSGGGRA